MLVRQVTAQVFGCDIKGVEIQLTLDEAISVASVLRAGIRNPNAEEIHLVSEQRALNLAAAIRDTLKPE